MSRTYGLGGGGLAAMGVQQQRGAMGLLGDAAAREEQRDSRNEQIEQQRRAGMQQLGGSVGGLAGAAIGAQYGAGGGPWGMAIGALAGTLAGSLF